MNDYKILHEYTLYLENGIWRAMGGVNEEDIVTEHNAMRT